MDKIECALHEVQTIANAIPNGRYAIRQALQKQTSKDPLTTTQKRDFEQRPSFKTSNYAVLFRQRLAKANVNVFPATLLKKSSE